MFPSKFLPALAALPAAMLLAACFESPNDSKNNNGGDTTLVISASYEFKGPDTLSSVDYGGQTVRLLLLHDIQSAARVPSTSTGTAITAAEILKYYKHVDADSLAIRATLADTSKTRLFTKYAQIAANKSLHDKVSPDTVIGYGLTADSLVKLWAATIAANSQTSKLKTTAVYHDTNGVDLSQLISKVLVGAVAYHQATGVYLQQIATKNNVAVSTGKNYTEMEHNWDEAFGYFGAARNYGAYTAEALNTGGANLYRDENTDGKIDFRSEYNFAMMGRYLGRRDRIAGQTWSADAFLAFRKGRALISAKRSATEIAAERAKVAKVWENLFAANTITYIKNTRAILDTIKGTNLNTSLSGNWSELKAFAICLQFSPYRSATTEQLAKLQQLIGKYPPRDSVGKVVYRAKLDTALTLVKTIHGFTDAQVNSDTWR
jgi:hypothetical protein